MLITGYIPSSSDCPLSSCSGPPVPSVATAVFEATLLLSGSEEVVGTGAADLPEGCDFRPLVPGGLLALESNSFTRELYLP